MRRAQVPLWIALVLKSQSKCNIVAPKWLNLNSLKELYDEERKFPDAFTDLPWNWLELSKIIMTKAADDLSDSTAPLRAIIQDLREIRQLKCRRGLKELNESNIQLNGLSLMEINELRSFVLSVMTKLLELHEGGEGDDVSDHSDPE